MSLRGNPVEEHASLPDGREAVVRIGVPDDPYLEKRELETVSLEVRVDGDTAAALSTVLDPEQVSEARALAREIVAGLESGALEPTGGSLQRLALQPR